MTGPCTRDEELMSLVRAIVAGDAMTFSKLIATSPTLATAQFRNGARRKGARSYYLDEIGCYIYEGHAALHVAAAAYEHEMARQLIGAGADIRAKNRRGAEPLHAACVGQPGAPRWHPDAQAATIAYLIGAGADPNAVDKSGVTPLHRAVRTRCAAAVAALLAGGADPRRKNKNGSTPMLLATQTTGRGGTGSLAAKAEQQEIVRLLEACGAA